MHKQNFGKIGGQLLDFTVYIIICDCFLFAAGSAAT